MTALESISPRRRFANGANSENPLKWVGSILSIVSLRPSPLFSGLSLSAPTYSRGAAQNLISRPEITQSPE
jgi:hypothetical protein